MDIINITPEDIAKMNEEERREYVRELLHAESGSGIRAAFYNPELDETIDMHEMAKQIGEEATIDLVSKALASADTEKRTITKAQFDEIRKKQRAGQELTEEEERMLKMVEMSLMDSDQMQCQKNMTGTMLSIIDFAQKIPHYNPYISDILASMNMLVISGLSLAKGTQTYNYRNDFATLAEISEQIGNDILDTWKASCTSEVAPEMIIVGLAFAAMRVSAESKIKFPEAELIFNQLGIDPHMFEEDDEEENEIENGSNILTPNTYVPDEPTSEDNDEAMRNLLKE